MIFRIVLVQRTIFKVKDMNLDVAGLVGVKVNFDEGRFSLFQNVL
jgi:hypothetical protein